MKDVDHRAGLITNVDMVSQVDFAGLTDTDLEHGPRLLENIVLRGCQVGAFAALGVEHVQVVVEVEEIMRHPAPTFGRRISCECSLPTNLRVVLTSAGCLQTTYKRATNSFPNALKTIEAALKACVVLVLGTNQADIVRSPLNEHR